MVRPTARARRFSCQLPQLGVGLLEQQQSAVVRGLLDHHPVALGDQIPEEESGALHRAVGDHHLAVVEAAVARPFDEGLAEERERLILEHLPQVRLIARRLRERHAGIAYGAVQNLTLAQAFSAAGEPARATVSIVWNLSFDAGTGLGAFVVGAIATATSYSVAFAVLALAGCGVSMPTATMRSRNVFTPSCVR